MRGISNRTILGVIAVFVGIAAIFVPDIAALLPFSPTLIDALGAALVAVGVWLAQNSIRTTRTSPDPPTPETRADLPIPGENFDRQLSEWEVMPLRAHTYDSWVETEQRIRLRLRSIAEWLLQDRYSMSESEAQAALDDGTWTDDPEASAYFVGDMGEQVKTGMEVSDFVPLGRFSGGTRAERVIGELDAIARGEREQSLPGVEENGEREQSLPGVEENGEREQSTPDSPTREGQQ